MLFNNILFIFTFFRSFIIMLVVMQVEDIKKQEEKIIEIINHLRPFLINDGGNIEFVKYEDGIVYIKMSGACAECSLLDITLKDGIEAAILEEVPEVKGLINLSSSID